MAAYHRRLGARTDERGVVEMEAPAEDAERITLAIVERAGGVSLQPVGGGRLAVQVHPQLNPRQCGRSAANRWTAAGAPTAPSRPTPSARAAAGARCWITSVMPRPARRSGAAAIAAIPISGSPEPVPVRRRTRSAAATAAPEVAVGPQDADLYAALVAWRREAANDKPAYTVATNRTLAVIAGERPANLAELGAVHGVGPAFLERFASDVLSIVAASR